MSKNDFLYALKEDLPQDFSDDLRQQLQQIDAEAERDTTPDNVQPSDQASNRWWTLAVATILVAFVGVVFFVTNTPNQDVLNIAQLPPTLSNHGELTIDTVSQLQPITTLGNGFVDEISLSPDGDTLLVSTTAGLYLHDPADLDAEPRLIPTPINFDLTGYTNDGRIFGIVYTGDEYQHYVLEINPTTGESKQVLNFEGVFAIQHFISPDGSRFFVHTCQAGVFDSTGQCGENDFEMQIFDIESETLGASFSADVFGNDNAVLSQDGRILLYTASINDGRNYVYRMDVATGQTQPLVQIATPDDNFRVEWLVISPDNQQMLFSTAGNTWQWDIGMLQNLDTPPMYNNSELGQRFTYSAARQTQPQFLADNETVIGHGSLVTWQYNIVTGESALVGNDLETGQFVQNLEFHPSGDYAFALGAKGEIERYSYPEGIRTDSTYRYDRGTGHQFLFRDPSHIMTIGNALAGGFAREWQLNDNTVTHSLFQPDGEAPYAISTDIALSPNSRYLYYVGRSFNSRESDSGYQWLHDLYSGERFAIGQFGAENGVTFLDNNTLVGFGNSVGYVLDVNRVRHERRIDQDPDIINLNDRYFSGRWSSVGEFTVIDRSNRMMATIPCFMYPGYITVEPCDNSIVIWDLELGEPRYEIQLDNHIAYTLAFSPDGHTLAVSVCDDDYSTCDGIHLYDMTNLSVNDTNSPLAINIEPIATIDNLSHRVYHMTFHPDGSMLAVAGKSLTTMLAFDGQTLDTIVTLPIANNPTFDPKGNLIYNTNQQGLIEIWGVPNTDYRSPENTVSFNLDERPAITADNLSVAQTIASIGTGVAHQIAISPDDNTLAIATGTGIYLHNAHDLSAPAEFIGKPDDYIRYMEYTDTGVLQIVTVHHQNGIAVFQWNEATQNFISVYGHSSRYPSPNYWFLQKLDLSPSGDQLLIATCSTTNGIFFVGLRATCQAPAEVSIQVIDLVNYENSIELNPTRTSNAIVDINSDWTQLAYYNGDVYLYDLATGSERPVIQMEFNNNNDFTLDIPTRELWSLYFNSDGSELGVLSSATTQYTSWSIDELTQYDPENPMIRQEDLPDYVGLQTSDTLVFNPVNGEHILGRSDVIKVPAQNGDDTREFTQITEARQVIMSHDGTRVYGVASTGSVVVWDWERETPIDIWAGYGLSVPTRLTISDDNQTIINANYSDSHNTQEGISYRMELTETGIDSQPLATGFNVGTAVDMVAISNDNQQIAYIQDEQLIIYDRATGDHNVYTTVWSAIDMTFRDDGSLIVIVLQGGYMRARTYTADMLASGDVPSAMESVQIGRIAFNNSNAYGGGKLPEVKINPTGETIAIYSCYHMIQTILDNQCPSPYVELYDLNTGELIGELEIGLTETGGFQEITFSTDGQYLALAYCSQTDQWGSQCADNQGVVQIWHIANILEGNIQPALTATQMPFTQPAFAFLPQDDSSFIVATTDWKNIENDVYDRVTTFWHVDGQGFYEISDIQSDGVMFSTDGRLLFVMRDGQIDLQAIPNELTFSAN